MKFLTEVKSLLIQEFVLEWRLRSAINGILLYVGGMIFMVALSYRDGIGDRVWYTTFWIVNFFIALQTVSKSFIGETDGQFAYRYQLSGAVPLIVSKLIYNCVLALFIILFSSGLFITFLGNPIKDFIEFFWVVILGALNLASSLTLISALVSATGNKGSLMATLSFPILFPQLLLLLRLSDQAFGGILFSKDLFYASALIVVNISLSIILFPILWKQ